MISLDHLEAFDHYIWLGSGTAAGERLACDQSTIWRQCATVCSRFRLPEAIRLKQQGLAAASEVPVELLRMERRVHQLRRFLRGDRLRLHAYLWSSRLLLPELPSPWQTLPADVDATRVNPLELLEERVIDAWMAPAPELPDDLPSHLMALPLYNLPLQALVHANSPLSRERRPALEQVAERTHLRMLEFVPSQARQCTQWLDGQLLGTAALSPLADPGLQIANGIRPTPPRLRRRSRRYGTSFTTMLLSQWQPLSWELPYRFQEFLVVLNDVRDHGPIQQLVDHLRFRLMDLRQREPLDLDLLV